MNLYHLQTRKLGDFYVIAKTPNDAKDKLEGDLQKSDYGFYDDRKVEIITIVAEEIEDFPEGKPNFSSKNKLLFANALKTVL